MHLVSTFVLDSPSIDLGKAEYAFAVSEIEFDL
jgi:hypothetical protein